MQQIQFCKKTNFFISLKTLEGKYIRQQRFEFSLKINIFFYQTSNSSFPYHLSGQLQYHRCTVIFKFFWGATWGCKKIYFRVLLHFYDQIFKVFWGCTWGAPLFPLPPCEYLCSVLLPRLNIRTQFVAIL